MMPEWTNHLVLARRWDFIPAYGGWLSLPLNGHRPLKRQTHTLYADTSYPTWHCTRAELSLPLRGRGILEWCHSILCGDDIIPERCHCHTRAAPFYSLQDGIIPEWCRTNFCGAVSYPSGVVVTPERYHSTLCKMASYSSGAVPTFVGRYHTRAMSPSYPSSAIPLFAGRY